MVYYLVEVHTAIRFLIDINTLEGITETYIGNVVKRISDLAAMTN